MNPDLGQKLQDRLGLSVRQIYGLTESCGVVTWSNINCQNKGTIGQPIPSFKIKICDPETGEQLGWNKLGELCIYSDFISAQYYRKPKETAELFDKHGYLKSGDLGYFDEDGYLYIIDRCKDLIKYKGTQVSPTEIEIELQKFDGVEDCAVVGCPDPGAGEVPAAFVVKSPRSELRREDVVDFLKGRLSGYKQLRGGVHFVEDIPRSPSGKVLRRKLKEKLVNKSKL